MVTGYVVSALVGLTLGYLVNVSANRFTMSLTSDGVNMPPENDKTSSPAAVISARFIGVELVLAALTVYIWVSKGTTPLSGILIIYSTIFLLVAVIDIEHKLIPGVVLFPAFGFGVVEVLLSGRFENPLEALAGYAIGQIAVMGIYLFGQVYLSWKNRNRETPITEIPFGFGDVTLATFCGLVIGYPRVILMLVLMILLGGLFSVLFVVGQGILYRKPAVDAAIPYGPAIVSASLILMLWGEHIARAFGAP